LEIYQVYLVSMYITLHRYNQTPTICSRPCCTVWSLAYTIHTLVPCTAIGDLVAIRAAVSNAALINDE